MAQELGMLIREVRKWSGMAMSKRTDSGTTRVYDELLGMVLNTAVRYFWDKRLDIIEVLDNILGIQVSQYNGDTFSDRNDIRMIVEKIIVRKDKWLDFTFINGS